MTIIPLNAGHDNYIWTIVNETAHTMTCVDPGEAAPVVAFAQTHGLTLTHILLTHHHNDHIGGVLELREMFRELVVYGPDDERIPFHHVIVRDEDSFPIENASFRVLSTPGHTRSHICYHEPTHGWLFCGDTLFSAGCGRVFDGTITELHRSLLLLKNLPNNTKIFCGHEYTRNNLRFAESVDPTNAVIRSYRAHLGENTTACSLPSTIALEKQINPFLRTDDPGIQRHAATEGMHSLDCLAVFQWLRHKKDNYR